MKYVVAIAVLVLASGCGGPASDHAAAITAGETASAGASAAAGPAKFKDDPQGCKDKTKSVALFEAGKKDDPSEQISLWAAGMQDQSCRGFSTGLGATVKSTDTDGWACAVPADDPDSACFWIPPGKVG